MQRNRKTLTKFYSFFKKLSLKKQLKTKHKHKSSRTNFKQIFQRHWLPGRTITCTVCCVHAAKFVNVDSRCVTSVHECLALFCLFPCYWYFLVFSVVLLKDFKRIEEVAVNMSQSCFLSLLRDYSWLGHHSHSKKGKGFH